MTNKERAQMIQAVIDQPGRERLIMVYWKISVI